MSIYRGAGGASDATDDSTVNAVAGYASAAASSASSAATSATNASNSATAAASSASSAASSASSVATNASNAASSAGLANTYATAANNSKEDAAASAATASTKAGEASTSASNAAASASTASTQATNAASSASAAATSASAASTSASNAASSAASALAIYGNTTAMNTAVAAAATSATNADTSADAAYDAQILAEAAVTGASSYASAAQVSANDSQAYAGASEAFKDSALAAASAANISATSAASSAASAATSATNAAASATSAAAITGSGNGTFVNTPITTNSTITLSEGRANGVAYLNGSKVLTTGSSLTFDGSNLSAFGSFTSGTTGVAGSYVLARSSDGAGTTVLESLAGTNNIGLRNTAGSLLFSANNAEGMRLTSTGLGIGTTSPSAKLHVFKSNQNQLQLQCDDTGQVNINMGGTTTPAKGSINFSDNANAMWFNTASTERMRLDSSGNLLVGLTSANANGGVLQLKSGITFPATAVASTDPNTLDDYEEGTWTPEYTAETGAFTTMTYSNRGGTYTKVGRQVTITGFLWTSNVDVTGASGALRITGLPFTSAANASAGGAGIFDRWTFASDVLTARLQVVGNQAYIEMYKNTVNSTSAAKVAVTDMTTGATTFRNEITFTVTYYV